MRFTAPGDTATLFLSRGAFDVIDGAVDLPDDLTSDEIGQLRANGFVEAPSENEPAPAPAPKAAAKAPAAPASDPEPAPTEG